MTQETELLPCITTSPCTVRIEQTTTVSDVSTHRAAEVSGETFEECLGAIRGYLKEWVEDR